MIGGFGRIHRSFKTKAQLTQRALDWRVRAAFSGIFFGSSQFR